MSRIRKFSFATWDDGRSGFIRWHERTTTARYVGFSVCGHAFELRHSHGFSTPERSER